MEQALKIFPLEAGPVATYGYLLTDSDHHLSIVIDAPRDSARVFLDAAEEEGAPVAAILLTHSHWDHTADVAALQRASRAPVYIHPADEYRLNEPMKHSLWPLPFTIEGVEADKYLKDGDELRFGHWSFKVLHAPGHSEGSVIFLQEERRLAFAGDVLFAGSIGRTDLPGGDMATLLGSIKKTLLTLDDAVQVFPGHGPRTTIGRERLSNPFLANL